MLKTNRFSSMDVSAVRLDMIYCTGGMGELTTIRSKDKNKMNFQENFWSGDFETSSNITSFTRLVIFKICPTQFDLTTYLHDMLSELELIE